MAHLHLQLFAYRLCEIAEDYMQRVKWVYAGVVPEIDYLLQAINSACSKQHFVSQRSLVFDDIEFSSEVLHFFNPIECCDKMLWNTDSLMLHFFQHRRDDLDISTKRAAIMFNLYVQIGSSILVRYDNNYEMMEQFTAQQLLKAADYLASILNKPLRRDTSSENTFVHGVFSKWKYVFDYTCGTCCDDGIGNCRYKEAIAWIQIHQTTFVVNHIRHLGTKMHAAHMRNTLPDRILPMSPNEQSIQKAQDIHKWSQAALYLLNVQEVSLNQLCFTGSEISRITPIHTIRCYLKSELEPFLGNIVIKPFGSRITGVANVQSDLDLQILSNFTEKITFMKAIEWAEKNKSEVKIIRKIFGKNHTAPMVLSIHVFPLGLTIDLSFTGRYLVANSALISYFLRTQPLARKLFFLLKTWKQQLKLSANFHHHVFNLMILFYMQQREYFPPIVSLLVGPVLLSNSSYNVAFAESFETTHIPTSLLALLKGFFAYWAEFNWITNGICVADGQVIPKQSFHITSDRKSVPPMIVSDIFNQSRNIAANIRTGDHQKFVQGCKEAVEVLKYKNFI